MADNTKLVLIGDPHFSNRKVFGRPTKTPGVNSRLEITARTLKWIAHDIPDDITHVCILGDITHEHGRLTPPVLHTVQDVLLEFAEQGLVVALMSGNHDIDANGLSIVPAFDIEDIDGHGEAVVEPKILYYSFPMRIYAIPYGSDEDALAEFSYIAGQGEEAVVLMHHHYEGAKHGAHEFQPTGGIKIKDIPHEVVQVFSGHYHLRQSLGKGGIVEYIGAPLQHDFGEADYVPGYTIVEFLEDGNLIWTFHEVPAEVAPRFHILPHNLDPGHIPGLRESDYYRIDLPTDVDPSEIEELKGELTNVIVRPVPLDADMRSRVEEHLQGEEKVTLSGVMDAYVAMNAEKERADRLSELGYEIAESVLEEV